MKTKNNAYRRIATTALTLCTAIMLTVATPAYAAILVQNFMQFDVVVDDPPITKLAGVDDALSDYLTVNLGGTITNSDSTLGTPGNNDTNLSHEVISFTCFAGDRTYYTDVIQLDNTTAAEDWDVTLTVEDDLTGDGAGDALGYNTVAAVETNFTAGDADIWLFTSAADSPVANSNTTNLPNPGNYGSLGAWLDGASPNGAIQLEVVGGTLSAAQSVTGPFTIPAGEERQLALVVDCGSNMVDGEVGTFRVTVAASPN